jgi:hypothetical protein
MSVESKTAKLTFGWIALLVTILPAGVTVQPKTSEVAAARKVLALRAKLRFTGAAATSEVLFR